LDNIIESQLESRYREDTSGARIDQRLSSGARKNDLDPMTIKDDISTPIEHTVSASRVFAIPELLEAILILLPTRDLLISQRVAKNWMTTIDGSHLLRQALFLEPIPAQTAWIARLNPNGDPEIAEDPDTFAIGKYTVTQIPATKLPNTQDEEDETTHTAIHVHLNTLLHNRGHWKQMTLDDRIERGEGLRLGRTKKKILGYGQEMFLTQPPCKELLLWVNWGRPSHIYNEDGVRFRDVLEKVESAPVLPYLPHMFMQAKGCIALTEEEERMVEEKLSLNGKGLAKEEDEEVGGMVGETIKPLLDGLRQWVH
jgi:hypothetical protein